jgi:hypothetical protein
VAGALWGRLTGIFGGIAVGGAAREAIDPILEPAKQNAWARRPNKVLDPTTAAELRAREVTAAGGADEGIDLEGVNLADDARRHGVGSHRFDLLTELARTEPDYASWLRLRRRAIATNGASGISRDAFRDVLRRLGLRFEWIDKLTELEDTWLTPEDVANAVQQGFLPNEGILPPDQPDGPPFSVPAEQVNLSPSAEAFDAGTNAERLKVLAQLSGNPPSPEQLAEMVLRGQIPDSMFYRGLREGRTKTKWSSALLYYLTHPRLTPGVVINLLLRGWIDKGDADRRLAAYGYTPEQVTDWYDSEGRPPTVRQAMIGYRRGARVAGFTDSEDFYVRRSVQESNIRPEWAELEHAANRVYPSPFVLRRIVADGGATAGEAADALFESGWTRDWADKAGAAFAAATPVKATYVSRAQSQLWTALHRSYLTHETDDAAAEGGLAALGVPAAERPAVLALWQDERALIRRTLTPAQVKKAYSKGVTNPDTGTAWTRADAVTYITDLGYDDADVNTYLDE